MKWAPSAATFLAPMEGVTHPILRQLMAERGGIGVVCTEFVRVTSGPLSERTLRRHIVRPSRGLLSVQVMGNHIEHMADAAAIVSDLGADVVDINLGCPAPRAVRKGVGSAMLKDPALLARVLSAMRKRTNLPLSAKIRAGFDDASHVLTIARAVEDSGADFITVHPRRRVDFYSGVADWRIIALLSRELSIPVVGNGDIWYAADALRMRRETGCWGVMLGRPALRNPWIFPQIEALSAGESPPQPTGLDVSSHLSELAARLGDWLSDAGVLGMLKEQLRYLGRAVPDGGQFLREACRKTSTRDALAFVLDALGPVPAEGLDLGAHGGTLEQSGSAEGASTAPGRRAVAVSMGQPSDCGRPPELAPPLPAE
jgi:tRNA-dihydrouridine synthase B